MRLFLIFTLCLAFSQKLLASELKPFATDYCTNFPEGTKDNPEQWKHCCLNHDLYMWAGGTEPERDEADLSLKECVAETGAQHIATLMYFAVRAGSHSPIKFPDKKWNNGWTDRPDYQSLTSDDIDLIEFEIYSTHEEISPEIKEHFINQLRSRLE